MATRKPTEAYGDEAPLIALFGQPARTKIIGVFVAERGRDLSKSEIARQAGVARSTVYDHLAELLELGVIEQTRTTRNGYSPRYQFDEDSELAEYLYKLEGVTLKRLLDIEIGSTSDGD